MIKVTLQCIAEDNTVPEDLQYTVEPSIEWITAYISSKKIMALVPGENGGTRIVFSSIGKVWNVAESVETLLKLIDYDKQ